MTVAELIAALSQLPPEAHVLVGYEGVQRTAHRLDVRRMYACSSGTVSDDGSPRLCWWSGEGEGHEGLTVPPGPVAVLVTDD